MYIFDNKSKIQLFDILNVRDWSLCYLILSLNILNIINNFVHKTFYLVRLKIIFYYDSNQ